MTQKSHDSDHDVPEDPPDEFQSIGFGPGDKVFDALARLRGVRRLGAGKLSLDEAIATAIDQGKAYERWSKNPSPVRRVQVWVEGRVVITVTREDASAKLKGFYFDVASPRDAVMQIVKADEGEEPVVLRSLPLNTVPLTGTEDVTELPGNKNITLQIKPEAAGRFDVQVAFGPLARVAVAGGSSSRTGYVPSRPGPNSFGVWLGAVVILLGLMLRMIFPLFAAQTANAEQVATKIDVERVHSNGKFGGRKHRTGFKVNSTSREQSVLTAQMPEASLISKTKPAEQAECVNCEGRGAIAESSIANTYSSSAVPGSPTQLVAGGELRASNETSAQTASGSELSNTPRSPSRDVTLPASRMGTVAIMHQSAVRGDRSLTPRDRIAVEIKSRTNETSFAGGRHFAVRPY